MRLSFLQGATCSQLQLSACGPITGPAEIRHYFGEAKVPGNLSPNSRVHYSQTGYFVRFAVMADFLQGSNPPLVSAVIPTRDRPQYLLSAVRSALRQTWPRLEVIVVVDGPDSETVTTLGTIVDQRLRLILLPESCGGSEARNAGVRAARGDWIAFLDDDDEWLPEKIERQMVAAHAMPDWFPVVSCRLIAQSPSVRRVLPLRPYQSPEPIAEFLFCRASLRDPGGVMQTSTLLAPRDLLLAVPFQPGLPLHQDWDWLIRVASHKGVGLCMVRQPLILRIAMIALALATMALILFDPSIGFDHSPGHATDWQGAFTQKNACGRVMVLATATLLFDSSSSLLRPARLATLAMFLYVLFMSGSRGAWMIEAAILLLFGIFAITRRVGQRIRIVLAVAAPLATFALGASLLLGFGYVAAVLGRDPTLTGRTAIWTQVAFFIRQRPFFGYGYDAFWQGMQGPSLQIAAGVHFIVAHAHNGFLEIVLELGLIGLLLFALGWLRAWLGLWSRWGRGQIDRIAWPAAILVLIALYDLDENTLLIYNGLFWPLFVSTLVTAECHSGDPHHTIAANPREMLKTGPQRAQRLTEAAQEVS